MMWISFKGFTIVLPFPPYMNGITYNRQYIKNTDNNLLGYIYQ